MMLMVAEEAKLGADQGVFVLQSLDTKSVGKVYVQTGKMAVVVAKVAEQHVQSIKKDVYIEAEKESH